ncbi:MAG: IS110 family transposase [Formosimonas sp.]
MNCKRIGIDIAKNVFQLHGVDARDNVVIKKRLKLDQMIEYFSELPSSEIAMEACGTSHYWSRTLTGLGHRVKLIAPQHVKPYVQRGKNDANDAAAICEAASRPHMKFVGTKTESAQAMQLVHRARSLTMKNRVALLNEIRSTLAEFGIVCKTLGAACTRNTLMATIHSDQLFPAPLPELFRLLANRLDGLDLELKGLDTMLQTHAQTNEVVQRLTAIAGVGSITASAMACGIPDISTFKNARDFGAWLGLTPRQHSSGGKDKLGGISKGGDSYLRTLLIQGAKSAVRHCTHKTDALSVWLQSLLLRRHANVVAVALANKTARVIWAMLSKGETYRIPHEIAVQA